MDAFPRFGPSPSIAQGHGLRYRAPHAVRVVTNGTSRDGRTPVSTEMELCGSLAALALHVPQNIGRPRLDVDSNPSFLHSDDCGSKRPVRWTVAVALRQTI